MFCIVLVQFGGYFTNFLIGSSVTTVSAGFYVTKFWTSYNLKPTLQTIYPAYFPVSLRFENVLSKHKKSDIVVDYITNY